jgi:hypothetical protein
MVLYYHEKFGLQRQQYSEMAGLQLPYATDHQALVGGE